MSVAEISLLIPVYNVEDYLEKCLDSIIAQTFSDFEVICVDDGSTDKSFEILEKYKNRDKRFTIVKQEHLGVGTARNLALSLAKSKYVQFLDSDDFFEPEMLEEMYNAAIKHNTDMVVCTARKIEPDGKFIEESETNPLNKNLAIFNKSFSWKDCPETIFNMFIPQPWQVLYKKELLDTNHLRFPDLTSSNGAALGYIARICAAKIVILNRAFINYRVLRPNSITSKKNLINQLKQLLEVREYINAHTYPPILKQSYNKHFTEYLTHRINSLYGKQYDEFKDFIKNELREYENIANSRDIAYMRIKKIINDNKIVFWGASLFLKDFIERYKLDDDNILGIIDINPEKQGRLIGKYRIYAPQNLAMLNPDMVIVSIVHFTEERTAEVEKFLADNIEKQICIKTILEEI